MVVTFLANNQKIMLMTTTIEKIFIQLCYKVRIRTKFIKYINTFISRISFIQLITFY